MKHTEHLPASVKRALAPDIDSLNERARQAWTEPMAIRPLEDGRYIVDSQKGATYIVDLPRSDCSCLDNEIRGALCKHIRRVAIEINQGYLHPPDRTTRCQACDREIESAAWDDPPHLCEDCHLESGDIVFDRERDQNVPLLVISVTDRRADEVKIPESGCTVAGYKENRRYSASDPVVEVVYPWSVDSDRPAYRYSFPISRLVKPNGEIKQTTLTAPLTPS